MRSSWPLPNARLHVHATANAASMRARPAGVGHDDRPVAHMRQARVDDNASRTGRPRGGLSQACGREARSADTGARTSDYSSPAARIAARGRP